MFDAACGAEAHIGLYFFEREYDATITVNGDIYRNIITNFLYPFFMVLTWTVFGFKRMMHLAIHINLLHQTLNGRLISRIANCYLWSYV